jgi:hypothetical protein
VAHKPSPPRGLPSPAPSRRPRRTPSPPPCFAPVVQRLAPRPRPISRGPASQTGAARPFLPQTLATAWHPCPSRRAHLSAGEERLCASSPLLPLPCPARRKPPTLLHGSWGPLVPRFFLVNNPRREEHDCSKVRPILLLRRRVCGCLESCKIPLAQPWRSQNSNPSHGRHPLCARDRRSSVSHSPSAPSLLSPVRLRGPHSMRPCSTPPASSPRPVRPVPPPGVACAWSRLPSPQGACARKHVVSAPSDSAVQAPRLSPLL